jgi:hypothetical protein
MLPYIPFLVYIVAYKFFERKLGLLSTNEDWTVWLASIVLKATSRAEFTMGM